MLLIDLELQSYLISVTDPSLWRRYSTRFPLRVFIGVHDQNFNILKMNFEMT